MRAHAQGQREAVIPAGGKRKAQAVKARQQAPALRGQLLGEDPQGGVRCSRAQQCIGLQRLLGVRHHVHVGGALGVSRPVVPQT